jgi:tetratricopeptide (TPR) repeat protein
VYLHWALRSENPELIAVAHWQYGDHMRFHQRYDEAQQSYERALELAPQTEYHSLYSIILSYMGQMYEERGDLDGATHYYRESYDRMKADEVRSATRPRNLGRMLLRKGVEAQACELFREALDNAIHLDIRDSAGNRQLFTNQRRIFVYHPVIRSVFSHPESASANNRVVGGEGCCAPRCSRNASVR